MQQIINDLDGLIAEFKEESERAAIILGVAKIDYLLLQILKKYLLPDTSGDHDKLLENDAPLATLCSRIDICYRFGLFDRQFTRSLHLLRKIRNNCAHSNTSSKLSTSPNREHIAELINTIKDYDIFKAIKDSHFKKLRDITANIYTTITLTIARLEHINQNVAQAKVDKQYSLLPKTLKKGERK